MSRYASSLSRNRSTIACKSPSSSTKISACFWCFSLIFSCKAMVRAIAVLGLIAAVRTPSVNPAMPLNGPGRDCRIFRSKGCQMFLGVQAPDPSCDGSQVPFHSWPRLQADLCRFVALSSHWSGQHAKICRYSDAVWLGYVNGL